MKAIARSLVVVFVALIAVPALAVSYTIATAVQLLATTALIMGGTGHPLGPPDDNTFVSMYMSQAVNNFIVPAGAGPVDNRVAVITPEQFFPVSGTTTFDDSVAEGFGNLNSCVRSGPCVYNPAFGAPDETDRQLHRFRILAERRDRFARQAGPDGESQHGCRGCT